MTAQVVLATGNSKKLLELRAVVDDLELDVEVLGLSEVAEYPEPAETERTFEGNALIKARACAAATGLPALADDSGIEVDVLNNMPGVRSARWAGPEADDEANLQLLLRQVADVPVTQRTARFVCAIALVLPEGGEDILRREWSGQLAFDKSGRNGFGYDPIFIPDGHRVTSAELEPYEKNAISHRGQAVRAIVPLLAERLAERTSP